MPTLFLIRAYHTKPHLFLSLSPPSPIPPPPSTFSTSARSSRSTSPPTTQAHYHLPISLSPYLPHPPTLPLLPNPPTLPPSPIHLPTIYPIHLQPHPSFPQPTTQHPKTPNPSPPLHKQRASTTSTIFPIKVDQLQSHHHSSSSPLLDHISQSPFSPPSPSQSSIPYDFLV